MSEYATPEELRPDAREAAKDEYDQLRPDDDEGRTPCQERGHVTSKSTGICIWCGSIPGVS